MLTRLVLQNIAIIQALDLSFEAGLNVLTGETGAGKSLILDAIQRVFLRRANLKELLSHQASKGLIELTFLLESLDRYLPLLDEAGIELEPEETELVVSREITPSASRCRVNGVLVPAEWLEKLGGMLLEIHGQHDLHSLFSTTTQRDILDQLGGEPVLALRRQVRELYREWQQVASQLSQLQSEMADRERQLDFLSYQCNEIASAQLTDADEDDRLKAERDRLGNVEQLRKGAYDVLHRIATDEDYQRPGVLTVLSQVAKILSAQGSIDPMFETWEGNIAAISEELRDLCQQIERHTETLEASPQRMDEIMDRLDQLEKLKRKYGGTLAAVLETYQSLSGQLAALQNQETVIADLAEQADQLEAAYNKQCRALSELRVKVAENLEQLITEELREMMLPAARFAIQVSPGAPGESGADQVVFTFSANPGEPLKPMAQVASGGELSRLMLALKIRTAHLDRRATLVLDEIDTGLSGIAVRAMAQKLSTLQQQCQLIVVTHQPIVAAKATCHLHVEKTLHADRVEVHVGRLAQDADKYRVLSRMASGLPEEDEATTLFVQQLLKNA